MILELTLDERKDGHVFRHEAMATELSLWLCGVDRSYAKQAAHAFFCRIDELEDKLSLYREGSDVTRINLLDTGESARLSADCVECLMQALEASRLTGSRFHPFLGVESLLVKGGVPPFLKDRVGDCSGPGDASLLEMDPQSRIVTKVGSGRLLDLGGIGKGYALDAAMEELEDWEVPEAVANFGGSTLLFRGVARENPWRGLLGEHPFSLCGNLALASSGVGFQGEHIVGSASHSAGLVWRRTFVRAATAGLADALSTGCMLMDEAQLAMLRERDPSLRVAASSEDRSWGVASFCEGAAP